MPNPLAQLSKQTARGVIYATTTGRVRGTTSGAGNAGGTTFIDSSKIGLGDDYYNGWYALMTSGTDSGNWRQVTDFTDSTGTFTVAPAFSAQIASTVTYELYKVQPDWITTAMREACMEAFDAIYKPVTVFLPLRHPHADAPNQRYFSLPNNVKVLRVQVDDTATEQARDDFTRDDSTTTPGGQWEAITGTWGISSNKLYSVSDADLDLVLWRSDPQLYNGWASLVVEGTMESATVFRTPSLVFRYLDASNFLTVGLVNVSGTDSVLLSRISGGTGTTIVSAAVPLTNGRQYELTVRWVGMRVEVWVDGVQYIDQTLTETERKYENGHRVGVYLAKAGSPATDARVDRFAAHTVRGYLPVRDWVQQGDLLTIGAAGNQGYGGSRLLTVDCAAPLTQPADDTTWGTLASDTTAVLEIEATDPAFPLFRAYCVAILNRIASTTGNANTSADAVRFGGDGERAEAYIARNKWRMAMPRPKRPVRGIDLA